MVAYFKFQHNVILLLGAAAGLLAAFSGMIMDVRHQPGYLRMFLYAMFLFAGVVIARVLSARAANIRLKKLNHLLYVDGDADSYIKAMRPLVNNVSKDTIEYIDGCNKLAFAYEARKEYATAFQLVDSLEPGKLKLHALTGSASTLNQKLRLSLLMKNVTEAQHELKIMREICETARSRAPLLASNLEHCIRLYSIWLNYLKGMDADTNYVKEEMELATNPIYKTEMRELLLSMKAS